MFTYNTTPHSSTEFSPYRLLFGYNPEIPSSLPKPQTSQYTFDDYAKEIKFKIQKSINIARQNLLQSKELSKQYFDKNAKITEFKIGDLVLLKNELIPKGKSKKK